MTEEEIERIKALCVPTDEANWRQIRLGYAALPAVLKELERQKQKITNET